MVANYATNLAKGFKANEEYSRAAALLRDIADTKMSRFSEQHEGESLNIARQLLKECGYDDDEISLIVDDAVKYHSCKDNTLPKSLEGRVLATADALAHLQTDFYNFAADTLKKEGKTEDEIKKMGSQ